MAESLFEVRIDGVDEVMKALEQLPVQLQKRALSAAFLRGASVVAQEARAQAHKQKIGNGGFVDSIKAVTIPRRRRIGRDAETVALVALEKPLSRLAHIFEYGTGPRYRNSTKARGKGKKGDHEGGYTGQIVARPFLRPALDIAGVRAIEVIRGILAENIESIATQLAAGSKRIALRYAGRTRSVANKWTYNGE